MKYKILFLTLIPYKTVNSAMIRNTSMIKGLIENGHKVDLIVIPNDRRALSQDLELEGLNSLITLGKDTINNNNSNHTLKKNNFVYRFFKKIWHMLSPYDYTYTIAKSIKLDNIKQDKYDYIISSSDPKSSHLAIKELIKQGLQYSKWIQYWGDPLAMDISSNVILPKFLIKKIERSIISSADLVLYVSPFTLEEQIRIFPEFTRKIKFLPIPFLNANNYQKNYDDDFVISYIGDYFSKNRNILPLYNAVKKNPSIKLTIIGNSDLKLNNTNNIKIKKRQVTDVESKSDLVICLLNNSGKQIPGKVYQLCGTNLPILIILDGEMSNEIKEYLETFNRFYFCNNNADEIRRSIINIKLNLSNEIINKPVKQLKPSYISDQLIRIINGV